MDKKVIIVGAGGHGKVIADIVFRSGDVVVGFLDDRIATEYILDIPVLGPVSAYMDYKDVYFVLGIGDVKAREKIEAIMAGVKWYTAIHPFAVISPLDTAVGEGSVIMASAVINPGAKIGRHCIINTGAIVEHDNQIEDYAHISVGARLAGTVHIGKRSWIGVGAIVKNNLSICDDCMIGAGAVVVKDIEEKGTYVGIPARRIH